jgi:N-acetylmuramoyl-L-alanine amidase
MSRQLFLPFFLLSWVASAAQVERIRVWHAPDQTRLVLDLSAAAEFDVFTVDKPDRVVIDLTRANAAQPLVLPAQVKGRILGLRQGTRNNGQDLRLVLDLAHGLELRKALLPPHKPYGHRLVIDLLETDPPPTPVVAAPALTPVTSIPVTTLAIPLPAAVSTTAVSPTSPQAVVAASPAPARKYVIAIDAGHGGEDVGAIGPRGTYEKTVVLAVARELASLINQEPDMRAVLTRDGDYYVDLRDRMVRARKHRADMFVSVHADAFRNRSVRGSSVYVLSHGGATSEAGRWLAERENAADLVGGVTLDDKDHQLRSVLLDLSQTASLEASLDVAGNVLGALRRVGAVHRTQVQAAGFMVLKSPDIPSLLVETAFISNPAEEQQLRDQKFRRKLAGAIRDGVKAYFHSQPLPGQRYAKRRQHRVTRGDTLTGIAQRYEVSAQQILAANNRREQTVRLGEVLRIP